MDPASEASASPSGYFAQPSSTGRGPDILAMQALARTHPGRESRGVRHTERAMSPTQRLEGNVNRIKWALVGTSGWADSTFAATLERAEDVELAGAVGSTPERSRAFQERHGTPRSYDSLADLAADDGVDAVWVATPNDLHASIAVTLLEAGRNVLVEKPLGISLESSEAALSAARKAGTVLKVGYHHRFRSAHQLLRQAVQDERLGEVGMCRFHAFARYATLPPVWRREVEHSGGWSINDVGTHLIDLVLWTTGQEATLDAAWFGNLQFKVDTDDSALLLLRLGNGGTCVVETSTGLESPASRIEVYGSQGWFRAENSLAGPCIVTTSWSTESCYPEEDAFLNEVNDFGRALRGEPSLGDDGSLALENVRLIQEARARWSGKS